MKTSIENINGQEYTVVCYFGEYTLRQHPFKYHKELNSGCIAIFDSPDNDHIATALPALPRNPTADDAPLLYRYMAEGIDLCGVDCCNHDDYVWDGDPNYWLNKITHATYNGERVEIAISGEV